MAEEQRIESQRRAWKASIRKAMRKPLPGGQVEAGDNPDDPGGDDPDDPEIPIDDDPKPDDDEDPTGPGSGSGDEHPDRIMLPAAPQQPLCTCTTGGDADAGGPVAAVMLGALGLAFSRRRR